MKWPRWLIPHRSCGTTDMDIDEAPEPTERELEREREKQDMEARKAALDKELAHMNDLLRERH